MGLFFSFTLKIRGVKLPLDLSEHKKTAVTYNAAAVFFKVKELYFF
ncbi:hypothetical protein BSF42_03460 [Flavobacterium sp. ACN6]|nr:hypothetical protein BSF42_03460 [Flavobacterium sp. ACN6]